MELDAFRSRLGLTQGRIKSAGISPTSAEYVFVLGDAEGGHFCKLTARDYAQIVQESDLTGVDLVRVSLVLRVPSDVPTNLAWEASLAVDGVKQARGRARPGRTRVLNDLAANVSKLSGVHRICVRLELVSA
jgi:hypothetical protein